MRVIEEAEKQACQGPVEKVGDIIKPRRCLAFLPSEPVQDIVFKMHGHHSGAAGVIDAERRLIGLITEREVLRRVFQMTPQTAEQERFAEDDKDLSDLTAWDIMIAAPVCLDADTGIQEALERITFYGFRYMPVTDKSGKLHGIVGERELFLFMQEKVRREMDAKDSLLSYFMHHEPYGRGAHL